jgi:transposase-like protein
MANFGRDEGKEQFWRDAIERRASGALSVREFCRRERLTESAFYAWRRTIQERDSKRTRARRHPAFLPVVLRESTALDKQSASNAAIEITLTGGRVLRLPASIPARRLAEIIVALDAAAAEVRADTAEAAR